MIGEKIDGKKEAEDETIVQKLANSVRRSFAKSMPLDEANEEDFDDEEEFYESEDDMQQRMISLVRTLVPPKAIGYSAKIQALAENATVNDSFYLNDEDARLFAEPVLANILEKVRFDLAMLDGYWNLCRFIIYALLFLILAAMQLDLFSTDSTATYGAIRDRGFLLSNELVTDLTHREIRQGISTWEVYETFLGDFIENIFEDTVCGDNLCQIQDEQPQWYTGEEGRSDFVGCPADCGQQLTTPVTISFFDPWKLAEHARMVEAIIASGEYCVDDICYEIEEFDNFGFDRPLGGFNICSLTEAEFGINTTVCVFDGDITIDDLPFRTAELDPAHSNFGKPVEVQLFEGNWEVRLGFVGFRWQHPRDADRIVDIGFPAVRGSVCYANGISEEESCIFLGACPEATRCNCEFIDNQYTCGDEWRNPIISTPIEVSFSNYDEESFVASDFQAYAGLEAVAKLWELPGFNYGSRITPLEFSDESRGGNVTNSTVVSVLAPVRSRFDDGSETLDTSSVSVESLSFNLGIDEDLGAVESAVRFTNLKIPPRSLIVSCSINFVAKETNNESTALVISVEESPLASAYATSTNELEFGSLSSRARAPRKFIWADVQEFITGQRVSTPDVSKLLQQLVDHPDWDEDTGVAAFHFEALTRESGLRVAEAFDETNPEVAITISLQYIRMTSEAYIVSTPADDVAEHLSDGNVFAWSDLPLGSVNGLDVEYGLRFVGISLQPNQTLLGARIALTALYDSVDSELLDIEITGELSPNSQPFGFGNEGVYNTSIIDSYYSVEASFNIGRYDLTSRRRTSSVVEASIPPFRALASYDTPDLSEIIREIIALPDWTADSSLTFFFRPKKRDTSRQRDVMATALQTGREVETSPTLRLWVIGEDPPPLVETETFTPSRAPTPSPSTAQPTSIPTLPPTPCQDRDRDLCFIVLALNGEACRDQFCPECEFAGYCDGTCGLCLSAAPTPKPTVAVFDPGTLAPTVCTDRNPELCIAVLALDISSCETFFCPNCPFANNCDDRCGFCDKPSILSNSTWHKRGEPSKDCAWVATFLNRCGVVGEDGTTAFDSCASICDEVDENVRRSLEATDSTLTVTANNSIDSSNDSIEFYIHGTPTATVVVQLSEAINDIPLFEVVSDGDLISAVLTLDLEACYVLTIGETTIPFGFSWRLGPTLTGSSPYGPQLLKFAGHALVPVDSCDEDPIISQDDDDISVIVDDDGNMSSNESSAETIAPTTSGPLRCYSLWIGTEPRIPTVGYTQCTRTGLYDSISSIETCSSDETHCVYFENQLAVDDECSEFVGTGGCWGTFFEDSNYDEASSFVRGEFSNGQCNTIGKHLFDGRYGATQCAGCSTPLCVDQDPANYSNSFRVSARRLDVAASGISRNALLLLHNGTSRDTDICDPERSQDSGCDQKYNTIDCNFDSGACCQRDEFSDVDYSCRIPWLSTRRASVGDTDDTWRYSYKINNEQFATVPVAYYRAIIEAIGLKIDSDDFPVQSADVATHDMNTEPYERYVPSLACPDCRSFDTSFSRRAFTVSVTQKNARGWSDWTARNDPELNCAEIERRASNAEELEELCNSQSAEGTFAHARCFECGARLADSDKPPQFTSFEDDEPRARYLTQPNVVIYGPILQQKRAKSHKCRDGKPFNSKLDYLDELSPTGSLCHSIDRESREPFGVDATFDEGSDLFRETNQGDVFRYYDATELNLQGQPFGWSYDMGSDGAARNYPVYWDVNLNRSRAVDLVTLVIDGQYFDAFTKSVKLTTIAVNREALSELLTVFQIRIERKADGGLIFRYSIQLVDTNPYDGGATDTFRLVVEICFIVTLFYMLIIELQELRECAERPGLFSFLQYFRQYGNLLDLTSYIISCLLVWKRLQFLRTLRQLNPEIHYSVYADGEEWPKRTARIIQYNDAMSNLQDAVDDIEIAAKKLIKYKILVMFGFLAIVFQLLKSFHFHPKLGLVSRTITKAGSSLIFWFVLQGSISLLYSLLGVLLFSQSSPGFGSFKIPGIFQGLTGFALLSLSGMYDPQDLEEIPGLDEIFEGFSFMITQLFFWSYMFISFFIMFNALLAIIVAAYEEVAEEMRKSQRDPMIFIFKHLFGFTKVPGGVISTKDLHHMLEAWVGHHLDKKIVKGDTLDEIIAKAQVAPTVMQPTVHKVCETRRFPDAHSSNYLLSFKASHDEPLVAFDRNLLALIARVYSRWYLNMCDPQKLMKGPRIFGAKKHQKVEPLSRNGSHRFAVNILARFGSLADLNHDGIVSQVEASAIRNLVLCLPYICDEGMDIDSRLAFVYNLCHGNLVISPGSHGMHTKGSIHVAPSVRNKVDRSLHPEYFPKQPSSPAADAEVVELVVPNTQRIVRRKGKSAKAETTSPTADPWASLRMGVGTLYGEDTTPTQNSALRPQQQEEKDREEEEAQRLHDAALGNSFR